MNQEELIKLKLQLEGLENEISALESIEHSKKYELVNHPTAPLRWKQLRPIDCYIWVVLAGRGWGKTRCGAIDFLLQCAYNSDMRYAAIASRTTSAVLNIMVHGESGLLALADPRFNMQVKISKSLVIFPKSELRSTELIVYIHGFLQAESYRGGNLGHLWVDELASCSPGAEERAASSYIDNMVLSNRNKDTECTFTFTQTPKGLDVYKKLTQMPGCILTSGHMRENEENISSKMIEMAESLYGDSWFGRQEIAGELLFGSPDSLWTLDLLDKCRVSEIPTDYDDCIIGIDPAMSTNDQSAETAITVGVRKGNVGTIVECFSGKWKPEVLADLALTMYDKYQASYIVVEKNQGGDFLLEPFRHAAGSQILDYIKLINSKQGKRIRAERVSHLWAAGRVKHYGVFLKLESEMVSWNPIVGKESPDSLDSMVVMIMEMFQLYGVNTNVGSIPYIGTGGDYKGGLVVDMIKDRENRQEIQYIKRVNDNQGYWS